MRIALSNLVVCAAVAAGAASYQPQQSTPVPKTPPEVTLTGCLVQGSSPTVFIFDNARRDPKSRTEKGVRYLVVVNAEDLNLRPHLNQEVAMLGEVEMKVSATPGPKIAEKNLPVFKTKGLTMVSNACSNAAKAR